MKTPSWFLKRNIISYMLWPLSLVYIAGHMVIYFSRLFWQKASKRPVICIGGILAGGVGKTPIVKEVAGRLDATIVMRGYKGKSKKEEGRSVKVNKNSAVSEVGDEAKMLSDHGLEVYIGDRAKNIEYLNYTGSPAEHRPIVMDDGFQNPTVKKDISILVFDEKIGIGNGFCLPAGPLREPLWFGLGRANAVIIIKNDNHNQFSTFNFQFSIKKPAFLAKNESLNPGLFGKVIAFAGIGYPQKFFDAVSAMPRVRVIESVSFPDHHEYTKQDILNLFKLAKKHDAELTCTEKDWVKLPENIRKKIKYVPLVTTIEPGFWEWLNEKLENLKK
ncbi:MAG: tetraacyldisaccharide 4'-kinase [Alphaproteobacteria bacterium]|nr:tetraacyldisaccharide 4'-kinase [Alphaproteobacteria bacterium]